MRTTALLLMSACVLTGCAYFSPQRHVAMLDTTNPKYNTPECEQARAEAMAYDDRMAERIAMGAGVGRLGPIGLGAAIKIDQDQHEKREAAKAKVDAACK